MNLSLPRLGLALGIIPAVGAVHAASARWTIETGGARVGVNGIRSYALPPSKMRLNVTRQVNAAFLRIGYTLSPRGSLGFGYTGFETLRAMGASPDSDIFDRGGVAFPAVVPLEFAERIREYSFDAQWHWSLGRKLEIAGGPVLSAFDSAADLGSATTVSTITGSQVRRVYTRFARYHETDLRLGGTLALRLELSRRWSLASGYRYAAPPARLLHIWSASVAGRF
jgi:hypothetical protein